MEMILRVDDGQLSHMWSKDPFGDLGAVEE